MKKVIAFMLSLCLLLMAGCKASVEVNDSGVYKNDKYDGVSAKTISGKDIVFEEEEYICLCHSRKLERAGKHKYQHSFPGGGI